MSFLNPVAPKRSDAQLTAPIDRLRQWEADRVTRDAAARKAEGEVYADFFQWERIKEDVLHFTPFDSLPQDKQDAINNRRRKQYEESYVPWIVTDITALLTGIDDFDDMGKTAVFAKTYALDPTARAIAALRRDTAFSRHADLQAWRRSCARKTRGRSRKQFFEQQILKNVIPGLDPVRLHHQFPHWGFFALLLQALQTTDAFFGVGVQLGPVLGTIQEAFFRGAAASGAPFSPADNKYNQILASRVTRGGAKQMASWEFMHPEDRLTALTALVAASDEGLNQKIVIDPADYPNAVNFFTDPASEISNFAGLGASIPYNVAALSLDALGTTLFGNWSRTVGGPGETGFPVPGMNNIQAQIMRLLEKGICALTQCDAELFQIISILRQAEFRVVPHPPTLTNIEKVSDKLGLQVDAIFWPAGTTPPPNLIPEVPQPIFPGTPRTPSQ